MGKRMLKIYYVEGASIGSAEIADVTYCCNKMRKNFDNFEFGRLDTVEEEPAMVIVGKNNKCIAMDCCPFCGIKIIVKPSRLN